MPEQKLKTHYVPELANKSGRAEALPDYAELCQWARERQQENLGLIKNDPYPDNQPLVQHDFIFHFLIQHYAQHFEIMHMMLVQKALQDNKSDTAALPTNTYITIFLGALVQNTAAKSSIV